MTTNFFQFIDTITSRFFVFCRNISILARLLLLMSSYVQEIVFYIQSIQIVFFSSFLIYSRRFAYTFEQSCLNRNAKCRTLLYISTCHLHKFVIYVFYKFFYQLKQFWYIVTAALCFIYLLLFLSHYKLSIFITGYFDCNYTLRITLKILDFMSQKTDVKIRFDLQTIIFAIMIVFFVYTQFNYSFHKFF